MSYFRVQCPLPLTANPSLRKRRCNGRKEPWSSTDLASSNALRRCNLTIHKHRLRTYYLDLGNLSWTRLDFGEHFGNSLSILQACDYFLQRHSPFLGGEQRTQYRRLFLQAILVSSSRKRLLLVSSRTRSCSNGRPGFSTRPPHVGFLSKIASLHCPDKYQHLLSMAAIFPTSLGTWAKATLAFCPSQTTKMRKGSFSFGSSRVTTPSQETKLWSGVCYHLRICLTSNC
jgi:hypothetical protein